ncbi:MAG: ATP-binding cassette domain-containing protein, partial [Actinobacteria bacterium]|nr:ATP-binding cassette domain-containing protein [Actinomycetota bacterium]
DLAMYPKMTGLQLVTYFANLRGGVDMAYVHELANRLGSDLSRRIGEYSSGNRQKVGLIQAFMHRPQLLVLDEPNAGLDPLVQ